MPSMCSSPARRFASLLVGTALWGVACQPPPPADDDAAAVVRQTTVTINAAIGLTYIAELFAGEPALESMALDEARQRAVELVVARMQAMAALFDCELEVETDDETFVILSFGGCTQDLWIAGEVRADLSLETTLCGPEACPSAVIWDVDAEDWELGSTSEDAVLLDGDIRFLDPVAAEQRMSWSTEADFNLTDPTGEVSTSAKSDADWSFESLECVTMSLDAILRDARDPDNLDLTTIVSATDVSRCQSACPTAGDVLVSYGHGEVLTWSYGNPDTDNETVIVDGPDRAGFEVELPCAASAAEPLDEG